MENAQQMFDSLFLVLILVGGISGAFALIGAILAPIISALDRPSCRPDWHRRRRT